MDQTGSFGNPSSRDFSRRIDLFLPLFLSPSFDRSRDRGARLFLSSWFSSTNQKPLIIDKRAFFFFFFFILFFFNRRIGKMRSYFEQRISLALWLRCSVIPDTVASMETIAQSLSDHPSIFFEKSCETFRIERRNLYPDPLVEPVHFQRKVSEGGEGTGVGNYLWALSKGFLA